MWTGRMRIRLDLRTRSAVAQPVDAARRHEHGIAPHRIQDDVARQRAAVSTLLGTTVHARQKELAIRSSLGAGRLRLLRQLLAEHLLLAALGGVAGGLLGTWMARALAPLMASRFTPGDLDVSPDLKVVMFTFGVSLAAAAAIGLLPALRWSRVNTLATLQGHTAG